MQSGSFVMGVCPYSKPGGNDRMNKLRITLVFTLAQRFSNSKDGEDNKTLSV